MEWPIVSIIVPCYNHRDYIEARLRTIEEQTYKNYELILLDDASTDGCGGYLAEYATNRNCLLLLNATNSGSPFPQWNRGISHARGEFIWIAESDDTAEPEFLASMIRCFQQNPGIGLVSSRIEYIDSAGLVIDPMFFDGFPGSTDWDCDYETSGLDEINKHLVIQNTIPSASAVVFRKSLYSPGILERGQYRLSGDYAQWVHILQKSNYYFLNTVLSRSRLHRDNVRSSQGNSGIYEFESLKVLKICSQIPAIDDDCLLTSYRRIFTSWLQGIQAGRIAPVSRVSLKIMLSLLTNNKLEFLNMLPKTTYTMTAAIIKKIFSAGRRPDAVG